MNDLPLVSVIIRTHNREALLQEAIQSVLKQSYSTIEIIVVNDGGKDVEAALPDTSEHEFKNIQYINLESCQGRASAANQGLDAAAGEYLIFLDDDDWFDKDHIAHLLSILQENSDYLLAYSAVKAVTDDEISSSEDLNFSYPYDSERLLLENYIPIHAVLFSKKIIDQGCRFDPQFDRFEDWDFWLQAAQLSKFIFSEKFTAHYRITQQSGFGVKDNEAMDSYRLAIYQKWMSAWDERQILDLLDRSRAFPQIETLTNKLQANDIKLSTSITQIGNLNNQLLETHDEINRQQREVSKLSSQTESLNNELRIIYSSRSWRVTRPLRFLSRVLMIYKTEGIRALLSRFRRKMLFDRSFIPGLGSEHKIEDNYKPLSFTIVEHPLVSIVIPVFNRHLYTFHCLQSIQANSAGDSYEIIVVDDMSGDKTQEMLAAMSGITVIRNERNMGFIHSCNAGAKNARGEYIVLLNNDTEVKSGWLDALTNTFEIFPDAGLVGARLVFPDGTLQEAGGIVWQNGTAWNYGKNDDPNRPEYSYCREVDYCSGACLMIKTQDFIELGFFDELYTPAYYEDTDLAFRVRRMGKKVYYQPMATIIHFEGISSGTNLSTGIKKYQLVNHNKFYGRWLTTLQNHRTTGSFPHLEKERNVDKRALVIDARILMPDHDSGSLRMFHLLQIFQKLGYKVSFVSENLEYHEKYTLAMQAIGIECLYHPYVSSINEHLQSHGHLYNVVMLSRADVAEKYIQAARQYCANARILFDTVDLHFLREQRQAELSQDKLMLESASIRKRQEISIARQADLTLLVSPAEIDLFRQEAASIPLALLSNIHQIRTATNSFHERKNILFIGNFEHPPNVDAMDYFVHEVFPILHQNRPKIKLLIVGANPPTAITSRATDNVILKGFVSDIELLFNDIKLSVAPLRYGAGIKGKINSSMAFGVPVIATTIAVEGMNLKHGKDVLIADNAENFASEIIRAYEDEALWETLSAGGKANIEKYFSFRVVEEQLKEILNGLGDKK